MTHDYKRNGTTTLFAALNVLDGQVIAQCQQRHRHTEWLQFLRQIDRETPRTRHCIWSATTMRPINIRPSSNGWKKHPRFHIHFTPTSASGSTWSNASSAALTDRLARGVFHSVPELITAIDEYIAVHNQNPKPFVWTAKANDILQKVIRANRKLGSKKNEALH